MNLTSPLARYQIEREQQLELMLAVLRQDERIREAWAFGSLGRENADALSDIDLIVVVDDEQLPAVVAERYTFAHKAGQPLFFLEAPQNAPQGGAYLMVCYDAPTAPHILDVYWQSERLAWDSSQARQLFVRSGLALESEYTGLTSQNFFSVVATPGAELPHQVRYFWMMFLIVAKYIGRNPNASEIHLFPYLSQACLDCYGLLGKSAPPEADNCPVSKPAQKLSLLRRLAEDMISLMAALPPPIGDKLFPAISRYLAMVE